MCRLDRSDQTRALLCPSITKNVGSSIISRATCLNGGGEEELEYMFELNDDLRKKYRGICDSDCKKKREKVEKQIEITRDDVDKASAREGMILV